LPVSRADFRVVALVAAMEFFQFDGGDLARIDQTRFR
jgi:hypothetical protein